LTAPIYDVLGFGAIAVDELLYVDHYPPADAKVNILTADRQGGGLTATALVAVTRLGGTAAYAGRLGDDDLSRHAINALEREGVDCSLISFDRSARPIHSTIVIDTSTGTRNIFADDRRFGGPPVEAMTEALVSRCRVLFVDQRVATAGVAAGRIARRLGIPIVADIERLDVPDVTELLAISDHLIVGKALAADVTGQDDPAHAAAELMHANRAVVVVTAGEQGAWLATDCAVEHSPAFEVGVADTTGCGDVFHGAYAAGLAHGFSVPECVELAAATAALKATQPGGRAGIPDWVTVQAFLKERGADGD
jgi:ribokinase